MTRSIQHQPVTLVHQEHCRWVSASGRGGELFYGIEGVRVVCTKNEDLSKTPLACCFIYGAKST